MADRSCDRAVALHVLFHMPDVAQALREIRRTLRPGGRAVFSTNARDHAMRLFNLHCRVAEELGCTPDGGPAARRLTLDELPLVRSVFPTTKRRVVQNAFLFPSVEPSVRYYATAWVDAIEDRPADGSHRDRLLPLMADNLAAIIADEGLFRVPKDAGCFVADL